MFELQIEFSPGYQVYFGKDDERRVMLSGGGIKKRQQPQIYATIANGETTSGENNGSCHAPDA